MMPKPCFPVGSSLAHVARTARGDEIPQVVAAARANGDEVIHVGEWTSTVHAERAAFLNPLVDLRGGRGRRRVGAFTSASSSNVVTPTLLVGVVVLLVISLNGLLYFVPLSVRGLVLARPLRMLLDPRTAVPIIARLAVGEAPVRPCLISWEVVERLGLLALSASLRFHKLSLRRVLENTTEKYNAAAILGWVLLRFTPAMLRDGSAIETIKRALKARRKERSA